YPRVKYSIWNGNSDDVIDRLMNGLCDLAVIMEPYNAEGLNALSVYKEPWVAVIPAKHPLAKQKGTTVALQSLAFEELILPSRKSRVAEILSWFDNMEASPVIRCEMAHMMNVYNLTQRNVGIAIFPASISEIPVNDNFVIKEITEPSFTASYVLVWNKAHTLSPLAERFMHMVKETNSCSS
ncbi:MAG TPA: LysR family transcriptional regulator substrate-binding protein, partial [Lachnospiraceae bacterium]|nr:LysR family transcriptional regulator substrate-binding protein [Lachnospiraceae bacterium]